MAYDTKDRLEASTRLTMASNTEGNTDIALEASMCGIAGLTLFLDFVSREEEQVLA